MTVRVNGKNWELWSDLVFNGEQIIGGFRPAGAEGLSETIKIAWDRDPDWDDETDEMSCATKDWDAFEIL